MFAKNYRSWWKFDEVPTKAILLFFFRTRCSLMLFIYSRDCLCVVCSEYAVELTADMYSDVALSDGAESVMNKWTPPVAVDASG